MGPTTNKNKEPPNKAACVIIQFKTMFINLDNITNIIYVVKKHQAPL